MTVKPSQILDYLIWALTVFMFSSFQILYQYSWGRYIFFACTLLILLLSAFRNRGRLRLKLSVFHISLFLFTFYVLVNSLWSMNSERTVTMFTTLLSISLCFSLLYWAYTNLDDNFMLLVTAYVVASVVIEIYTLIHYGFNNVLLATHEARLDNEYTNVNSIAVFLAIGVVFNLYLILLHGFKLWNLIPFFSVIVLAAIQSRKAIVVLVLGVLALIVLRTNANRQSILNRILIIVFLILLFLTALYLTTKLPMFAGLNSRLDQMFNSFTGAGKADTSSIVRNRLIDIGLTWWAKAPIGGNGIDATREISRQYLDNSYYMHNNYVELLCGGGLVGFCLYYSLHAVLLVKYIKRRLSDRKLYVFGIILLGIILISDFGRVTYYSKTVFFEIMMLYAFIDTSSAAREGLSDE